MWRSRTPRKRFVRRAVPCIAALLAASVLGCESAHPGLSPPIASGGAASAPWRGVGRVAGAAASGQTLSTSFYVFGRLDKAQGNARNILFLPTGEAVLLPPLAVYCGGNLTFDDQSRFFHSRSVQYWPGDKPFVNVTSGCAHSKNYDVFFENAVDGNFGASDGRWYGVMADRRVAVYDTTNDGVQIIGVSSVEPYVAGPTDGRHSDHFLAVAPLVGTAASVYSISTADGQWSLWGKGIIPEDHRVAAISEGDGRIVVVYESIQKANAPARVRVVTSAGDIGAQVESPLPNGCGVTDAVLNGKNELFIGTFNNESAAGGGIYHARDDGVLQQVACAAEIWWMAPID